MVNSMFCIQCENWFYGKWAKIKRVATRLVMRFVCSKCRGITCEKYVPLNESQNPNCWELWQPQGRKHDSNVFIVIMLRLQLRSFGKRSKSRPSVTKSAVKEVVADN